METSLFLAKIIGIFLIMAGLLIILRQNFLREVINDYFESPALVLLGGAISLLLGLLVINSHNVWEMNWRGVITALGYLMVIKGLLHWFFLDAAASISFTLANGKFAAAFAILYLLFGSLLALIGYGS